MHGGWMRRKRKLWSACRITAALEEPGGEGGARRRRHCLSAVGRLEGLHSEQRARITEEHHMRNEAFCHAAPRQRRKLCIVFFHSERCAD